MTALAATVLLLVAGGAGLVVQNTVMLAVREQAASIWSALWLNSLVGLVMLTVVVVGSDRLRPFQRLVAGAGWWMLIPGVLGTLYVLASLRGYATIGATATIALLVSSQLIAGLVADSARTGSLMLRPMVGAGLLLVGVALIVTGRG